MRFFGRSTYIPIHRSYHAKRGLIFITKADLE